MRTKTVSFSVIKLYFHHFDYKSCVGGISQPTHMPGQKLVVRSRFEPWICFCQSFILLRLLEVEKFRAQKFVYWRRKTRFTRSYLKLIKNGYWTRYLHYINIYKIYKLTIKRPFVVFWEIILHFSIVTYKSITLDPIPSLISFFIFAGGFYLLPSITTDASMRQVRQKICKRQSRLRHAFTSGSVLPV